MSLLTYLEQHFYNTEQLLQLTGVSHLELNEYQANGLMPQASYELELSISCQSFFGNYNSQSCLSFYNKGYVSWLSLVHALNNQAQLFQIFSQRYQTQIKTLKQQGHHCKENKLNDDLAAHIEAEWLHFLNGTYGLCTQNGLPEDIAKKEMAMAQINELLGSNMDENNKEKVRQLTDAVHLLDAASAEFAPHERPQSSRHRLIDEVKRQYRLA